MVTTERFNSHKNRRNGRRWNSDANAITSTSKHININKK
jgi:hypothetical protein